MSDHPGLKEFCTELRSLPVPSAPLLCFMVTMYEQEASTHKGTPKGKQSLDTALEVSLTIKPQTLACVCSRYIIVLVIL